VNRVGGNEQGLAGADGLRLVAVDVVLERLVQHVDDLFTGVLVRRHDDPNNPHVVFRNNNRGYVRCTVSGDAWTSEYRIVPTVRQRGVPATTLATFAVENGKAGAVETSGV
jgi:phosphodiesterase/alkaline phosphatase D-like protein